jgi:hypothetical protein
MKIKVDIVYEEKNEDSFQELGIDAEIIEYIEEGIIDLKQVVACSNYHEHTQVFTIGGHTLIIDFEYEKFARLWMKVQ